MKEAHIPHKRTQLPMAVWSLKQRSLLSTLSFSLSLFSSFFSFSHFGKNMKVMHAHYKILKPYRTVLAIEETCFVRVLPSCLVFFLSPLPASLPVSLIIKITYVTNDNHTRTKRYRIVCYTKESPQCPSPNLFIPDGLKTYPIPFSGCIVFCSVSRELFTGCLVSLWNVRCNCYKSLEEMPERYKLDCLPLKIPFHR